MRIYKNKDENIMYTNCINNQINTNANTTVSNI